MSETIGDEVASYANTLRVYSPRIAAGFLSAVACIQLVPADARFDLANAMLVRSLDAYLVHFLRHHNRLKQRIPAIVLNNFDSLSFIWGSQIIMSAWFRTPRALPRWYEHWITKASGTAPNVLHYFRTYGGIQPLAIDTLPEVPLDMGKAQNYDVLLLPPSQWPTACAGLHPHTDRCTVNTAQVWSKRFVQYISMYVVVHFFLPMILSRRIPLNIKPALHTLRSSAFLATYTTLCWVGVCGFGALFGKRANMVAHCSAALSGLSIFIEKRSRRAELALYILPRALEVLWWRFTRRGGRKLPMGTHIMFGLSMAALICNLRYTYN